ncbi:MAG: hypothetical protein ACI9WT_001655, partial [Flavobacterium sp.]
MLYIGNICRLTTLFSIRIYPICFLIYFAFKREFSY